MQPVSKRGLALLAFALVAAGAGLASVRVWWHEQWDRTDTDTLERSEIEAAETAVADPEADWVSVDLVAAGATTNDVFVSICVPPGPDDADLTGVDRQAVRSRLVVAGSAAGSVAGTGDDVGSGTGLGTEVVRLPRAESAVVWQVGPLGEAELGPAARDDCLFFSGRPEAGSGIVQLVWQPGALAGIEELDVAVAVRHPLGWPDRGLLVLLFGGLALLVYAGQTTAPLTATSGAERQAQVEWTGWHALIAMGVWLAAMVFTAGFGRGRAVVFLGGLVSMGAYVAACWLIAERLRPGNPLAALAFHRISKREWSLVVIAGLGLAMVVALLLPFMPQGESAMTQVLQTSGGLVSVLTMALIAPWSEELLLRGVLYGALERWAGPVAAVLGSALIFSFLHLGQHLGNLAPWVMITLTGLVMSLVRWRTGSTLASTGTHLAYNLSLALPVLFTG